MREIVADLGIEILVRLAREGEIDPWDVDLIEVTDRYLKAIDGLEVSDLIASAKLIFYASVLLHLKAQVLARGTADLSILDDPDAEALADELAGLDLEVGEDGIPRHRRRRPIVGPDQPLPLEPRIRLPRQRTITLFDLITALRSYEARLAEPEPEPDDYFEVDIAAECIDAGHREDPEAEREAVSAVLGLPTDATAIFDFEKLCVELEPRGFNRASVYLAVLFMASSGLVELEQERLWDTTLEVVVGMDPEAEEEDQEPPKEMASTRVKGRRSRARR